MQEKAYGWAAYHSVAGTCAPLVRLLEGESVQEGGRGEIGGGVTRYR